MKIISTIFIQIIALHFVFSLKCHHSSRKEKDSIITCENDSKWCMIHFEVNEDTDVIKDEKPLRGCIHEGHSVKEKSCICVHGHVCIP